MKFSGRDLIIAGMVAVILFLLFRRGKSMASTMTAPAPASMGPRANCNPTAVDAKIPCVTVYPEYPLVGDMIDGGKKKYCCKTA